MSLWLGRRGGGRISRRRKCARRQARSPFRAITADGYIDYIFGNERTEYQYILGYIFRQSRRARETPL